FVSVIMPIRNEARYIAASVEAVATQDYARDRLEILVVDGMSDDGTRQIVLQLAARDPRIRLLDNPQRIVPTALNRGIRQAQGQVILRVDGHAVIRQHYIRRCVQDLAEIEADCVGGPIHTVAETWVAKGIAAAQSSPFGVGNAAFRYADRPQYVDTLAFGAYRRQVFDQIGLFDEELVRNQDDEFNLRLTDAGGKIWLDPAIGSEYYSRVTLRALWSQYFGYGYWKVRVIIKRGRPASLRHLVPAAFVAALIGSAALGLLVRSAALAVSVAALYLTFTLCATVWLAVRRDWRVAPVLPLALGTLHLAYGLGFFAGGLRFGLHRSSFGPKRPASSIAPIDSTSGGDGLSSCAGLEKTR
ncbi:MAG: glycosyltransferase family 2 protein, partial [Chloroflexi bacterium]|nr:glycosyltransferase family 2 protein [Chloroflexota bacterium]